MRITIKSQETGNYDTRLYNLLNTLDGITLFNDEHDLRHPLSIYLLSFSNVIRYCSEVLDLLEKKDSNVKEKYIMFLNSVNAFIDDGYNILKCFYPSNAVNNKEQFADRWLEKIDSNSIKTYRANIKPYIKDTRYIINKVKHEHGRITQMIVKTNIGSCLGFFLEKYHDGALQPDEEIHKKYNNQHTCFSYKLNIMKNLCAIYYISEELSKYIENNIIKKKIILKKVESTQDKNIKSILKRIWSLGPILFEDEYFKALDVIELDEKNEEIRIISPAPKYYNKKFMTYKNCEIMLRGSGDRTSRTFVIPYMGGNKTILK